MYQLLPQAASCTDKSSSGTCYPLCPAHSCQERLLDEIQVQVTESHISTQKQARILLQQLTLGSASSGSSSGSSAVEAADSWQVLGIPGVDDDGLWLQQGLDMLLVKPKTRQLRQLRQQQPQVQGAAPLLQGADR